MKPVTLLQAPFKNLTIAPASPPLFAQSFGTQVLKASWMPLLLQKQFLASCMAAGSMLTLEGGAPVPVAPPVEGGDPFGPAGNTSKQWFAVVVVGLTWHLAAGAFKGLRDTLHATDFR